ncbi:phosphotransferase family protein [Bacillus kexueae]|uniref:phosphotransferase family protein n=1 Tax=Aeribacillus kexueae TaxID=2078952 RepID=UPI001FB00A02|nr:phosphotransferase family protein [Bacillus kexueae]
MTNHQKLKRNVGLKLNVNWLEYVLGSEWAISPAGGATGDAYYAEKDGKRLFLKRNSSPFLAVLSAEGIVPKLVWTRRMENGDVITAQHWLNGRELKPKDMNDEQVAQLLYKIHHSQELLDMLKRLGKQPLTPGELLSEVKNTVDQDLILIPAIQQALVVLEEQLPNIQHNEMVVCHCDINHNNWLLSNEERLYLIDWDGAMIADPAIDLGMLLYSYIPENEWEQWLQKYGVELTENLMTRMNWYVLVQLIISVAWLKTKGQHEEMQLRLQDLHGVLTKTY